nr:MAG TPA: hypothetical protein [Caudoviricetes sp.]
MIRPKHYNYHNRSRPAMRERTILITSVKRSHLKEYSSLTSSGKYLKRDPGASLNIMPQSTML